MNNDLMKLAAAVISLLASSVGLAQPRYGAIGELYAEACSACHGNALEGTPLGVPLVGAERNPDE